MLPSLVYLSVAEVDADTAKERLAELMDDFPDLVDIELRTTEDEIVRKP